MEHSTARTNLALTKRGLIATVCFFMFLAGLLTLITGAQTDPLTVRVDRVIDGKTYTVRLIGVDTPEGKHPTKDVQYLGTRPATSPKLILKARRYGLKRTGPGIPGTATVTCSATVTLHGENFNARLIRMSVGSTSIRA